MGRCEIMVNQEVLNKVMDVDLFGRTKEKRGTKLPGKLYLKITTSSKLTSI